MAKGSKKALDEKIAAAEAALSFHHRISVKVTQTEYLRYPTHSESRVFCTKRLIEKGVADGVMQPGESFTGDTICCARLDVATGKMELIAGLSRDDLNGLNVIHSWIIKDVPELSASKS